MSAEQPKEFDTTTQDGINNLAKVAKFRYQMLYTQLMMDLKSADISQRTPERVLFTAFNQLYDAGLEAKPPANDNEKRMVGVLVELLNSLMLMVTLKETEKRIDTKGNENV